MNGAAQIFDLSGKVAVITGGGRGIGFAIAQAMCAQGARAIICGRSRETLDRAVQRLQDDGYQADSLVLDVADEAQSVAAASAVKEMAGRVDILVNNAGIDPHYASLEKTSSAQWHEIIDVNLHGVFHCCHAFGQLMLSGQGGSVINISSIAGHVGLKRQAPYCATKGGVELFTKALALDWAEKGIRVNAIAYGFVETDLTAAMTSHAHLSQRLISRIPMQRFGTLDDVAGAAVFLASNAASYITGHSLLVDGGWTAS